MMYFELKQDDSILGSNLDECSFNVREFLPELGRARKLNIDGINYVVYFDEQENIRSIVVVAGDKDLSSSPRLRGALLPAMINIFHHTVKFNVGRAHDYTHSVNTLHGKMKQKLEEYADPEEFYGETYSEVCERIEARVLSNPKSASDIIIYLSKRVADMGAHLRGFEVMETQESFDGSNFMPTRLRSALLSSFSTIQGEMYRQMWIKLKVNIDNNVRVIVDKELLNLVLYNIFDNTRKYILADSEIHANWNGENNELIISMTSLAVNPAECDKIFYKNYRGERARARGGDGKGLGLFVVKQAMKFMGGDVSFIHRIDKDQRYGDELYRENYFHLKFKTAPLP